MTGTDVQLQMDTGAQLTVLPKRIFDEHQPKPDLMKTFALLVSFTGSRLKPARKSSILCLCNGAKHQLTFDVVDPTFSPLLSENACQLLSLIKFVNEVVTKKNPTPGVVDMLLTKYPDVFKGLDALRV